MKEIIEAIFTVTIAGNIEIVYKYNSKASKKELNMRAQKWTTQI